MGRGSERRGVADGRRQRDTGSAQGEAGGGTWCPANDEAFAVIVDLGLGQRIQIDDDVRPGAHAAERGNALLQPRLQHQRKEAAEHVTTDGLVQLVEDRPGGEQMLCGSKGLLHRPKLLVAEHGLERVEIGVGAQHEDAVELLLLLDLVEVDRKVLLADRLEIAPKAGVADQSLASWRSNAATIEARSAASFSASW
jgi:hypothetical protein